MSSFNWKACFWADGDNWLAISTLPSPWTFSKSNSVSKLTLAKFTLVPFWSKATVKLPFKSTDFTVFKAASALLKSSFKPTAWAVVAGVVANTVAATAVTAKNFLMDFIIILLYVKDFTCSYYNALSLNYNQKPSISYKFHTLDREKALYSEQNTGSKARKVRSWPWVYKKSSP